MLGGSFSNVVVQRQPLELPAQDDLAVGVEADDVEDVLADIDADGRKVCADCRGRSSWAASPD